MSIHIKPENRGKFNATKARTGKSTEELTHSSNPVTKKRAVFAQNAAKWKHRNGGPLATDLFTTDKRAFVDSTLNANKNLDFVQRLYDPKPASIQIPGEKGTSTHFMANDPGSMRVYPEVVRKKGQSGLTHLIGGDDAWNYADSTKEFIPFNSPEKAKWFANSPNRTTGYKMGTGVMPKKEQGGPLLVGNQHVAMGGSLKQMYDKRGTVNVAYGKGLKKYLLGGPTDETDRSSFITSKVVPGTEDMSSIDISGKQTPFSLWSTNQNMPAQPAQEGVFNMADNQQRGYKVETPEAPAEFKNKELAAKSYNAAIQAGTSFIGNFAEKNRRKQEGAHDTGSMDDIKGAAKGMGTGASIGSTFGPIGTAVGAAVGGIAGYIGGRASGKVKKKAYDAWQADYMKAEQSIINSNSSRYQDLKPTSSGYYRNGGALSRGYLKTMAFGGDTEPDTAVNAPTPNLPNSKFTYVPSSPAPSPQMPSPVNTYTRTFRPNPSGMPVYNPSSNSTEVLEQGSMRKGKLDPASYLAKKKLLEENGSPDVTAKEGAWPHYNPFSSTIVLPTGTTPNKFTRNLIEETAHSKQDKENPIGKGVAAGWAKDWLRSPSFSMRDYQKFYHPTVTGPNYMEYEAHGNIAPGLHARYGELRDSLKGRQNKGLLTTYRNGGQTKTVATHTADSKNWVTQTPVGYDWKSNAKYNKAVEDTAPKQKEDFSPAVNYAGNVSVQTLLDQASPGKLYNMYNTGKDAGKAFKNKDYLKAANLIGSEFVKLGVPVIGDMGVNAAQELYSPSGNSFNQLKKDASTVSSLYKKANGGTVKRPQAQFTDYTGTQMYGPGGSMSRDGFQVQPTRQDSLDVMNSQVALNKFYDNEVKNRRLKRGSNEELYNGFDKNLNDNNLYFYREQIKDREERKKAQNYITAGLFDNEYKNIFNLSPSDVSRLEYQGLGKTKSSNTYKQYYRDLITPLQNLASPFALMDTRIRPQHLIRYSPNEDSYPGGAVSVLDYDPIVVKPADLKTKADWDYVKKNYPELYKQPVQPVELQSKPSPTSPRNVASAQAKIKPKKTSPSMQSLQPQRMQSSPVSMQGQPMQIQPMTLPQQKGKPVYGPGNTIIGYSGQDMKFSPAYQYTGAPNSEVNLQDKVLLSDPEKLKQYVGSRDSGYKFATGGSMASNYMANQKAVGGSIQPMSKDASIAVGPSHEQGGIALPDQQAEIEGGETMSGDYVFSKQLGFAALHKPIAKAQGKIEAKASTPERLNTLKLLADKTNKLKLAQEYMKKQLNLQ